MDRRQTGRSTGPSQAGMVPMPGGMSGETFLAEAPGERSVVRIYAGRGRARGPAAVEVDAAVLRLVRGLVPVPEVREVRRADPRAGTPALLVTSVLPGERLDLVLPALTPAQRRQVGHQLGELLARLAQMPMPRPGLFADGELRLGPLPPGGGDLVEWTERHCAGTALEEWSPADRAGLAGLAAQAQDLLDTVRRATLVHSDFNPKNLLVDPETARVTGVLDWEFAHAGGPYEDLGNLVRFDRDPAVVDPLLSTFADRVPDAPGDATSLLSLARAADLFALVELASRRDDNPVARRAHDLLLHLARTGDLHATT